MRVNKRRRLAPVPLPMQGPLPSPDSGLDAIEEATETPTAAAPQPPLLARMAPPRRLDIAQVLQEARMRSTVPPLTPPLGARVLAPEPSAPAAAPASGDGLAQLRLQQGSGIDHWRSHSFEQLDAASCLIGLRGAIVQAQHSLERLADRPTWRERRSSTLEALVDEATGRLAELGRQPHDIPSIAELSRALQQLAPQAWPSRRPAFLAAVQRSAEHIFSSVGGNIGRLESAFRSYEALLPKLQVGFDDAGEQALRQALVAGLWYRLLEAPEALSTWSIQTWTERSQAMCHRRPCPQIAALVWLRALLNVPHLDVAQCVSFTHRLREAWAVQNGAEPSGTYAQRAATLPHLPGEPDFEAAARAQLATWVALLPHQLPTLAPFQAEPVRDVFAALAAALHIQIDIEIGQPLTDGDEDMQTRDLAEFVREWEREHRQAFPGFEALFAEDAVWDAAPALPLRPSDSLRYEDPFDTGRWTPELERTPTPRVLTPQNHALAHHAAEALAWMDQRSGAQASPSVRQTPLEVGSPAPKDSGDTDSQTRIDSSSSGGSVTPGFRP